ncbi:hypothetical protein EYF80_024632 [Liparis tanakae]|uniref:Uncharacterized protein n=1 Tax=Liparis tanakae TaxID=230148 RepID=A0A4Z2HJL1_9TELE|nr:hypothetical protein EYF80_024632 [Liparis tanakae]
MDPLSSVVSRNDDLQERPQPVLGIRPEDLERSTAGRLCPSGFWELKEKLWTPVEKSNWLISSLRLLSAMYDWDDRYTGASVGTRT